MINHPPPLNSSMPDKPELLNYSSLTWNDHT